MSKQASKQANKHPVPVPLLFLFTFIILLLAKIMQTWCTRQGFEDGSSVREAKLVLWLTQDVLQRRHPPKKSRKRKLTMIEPQAESSTAEPGALELADEAKEVAKPEIPLSEPLVKRAKPSLELLNLQTRQRRWPKSSRLLLRRP